MTGLRYSFPFSADTKETGAGSGKSSVSSGSGVLVPNVDDKDVDWDDGDDDLDFNEEMSEEEVKRIMESMANKKQTADDGAADLDVSQWFKMGLRKFKKTTPLLIFSGVSSFMCREYLKCLPL